MIMTTQDIIKLLPFDEGFKSDLLGSWDSLSTDQKLTITDVVWEAYGEFYNARFEKNMSIAMADVAAGKANFSKDFYKKVKEQTEQEMQQLEEKMPEMDLSDTRAALQDLLKTEKSTN
jgi:hypothetical protein